MHSSAAAGFAGRTAHHMVRRRRIRQELKSAAHIGVAVSDARPEAATLCVATIGATLFNLRPTTFSVTAVVTPLVNSIRAAVSAAIVVGTLLNPPAAAIALTAVVAPLVNSIRAAVTAAIVVGTLLNP